MKTYTTLVTDQTVYPTFIEYVVRFINTLDSTDFFEKRFQADGTVADLQSKVSDYLTSLAVPPPVSEIPTGTALDLAPVAINPVSSPLTS